MTHILTKRTALRVTPTATGVDVERHSWLTRRSKRMPDAVNAASFNEDELLPLAAALIAEAERRAKAAAE